MVRQIKSKIINHHGQHNHQSQVSVKRHWSLKPSRSAKSLKMSPTVIALGYFFGRSAPSTPADPKSVNAIRLAGEAQKNFRDAHKGVLCCHVHIKGMEMGSEEHKSQCEGFTGEMAAKAAEIIARELNIEVRE